MSESLPTDPTPADVSSNPRKVQVWQIAGAIAGIFVFLTGIAQLVGAFSSKDTGPATAKEACLISQSFVKDRLTAPTTAKFPNCKEVTTSQDVDKWTVAGHVDSQDGAGAMVRTQYVAVMDYLGGKDRQWRLTSLETP